MWARTKLKTKRSTGLRELPAGPRSRKYSWKFRREVAIRLEEKGIAPATVNVSARTPIAYAFRFILNMRRIPNWKG